MPESNPFAPPAARVADVNQAEAAPALWNPNAAASWSLIFSPIFGAYLHARNWEALGQLDKAARSRNWMVISGVLVLALIVVSVLLPDSRAVDAIGRFGGLGLLFAWYYAIGKSQQAFVQERFGKDYPHRGWLKPLLAALAVLVAFTVGVVVVAGLYGLMSRAS